MTTEQSDGACTPFFSSDVLSAAGVAVGDVVIWRWNMPLFGMSDPKRMTVIGEHRNADGVPAVEVQDDRGMKFRAYPGELFAADNSGIERKEAVK